MSTTKKTRTKKAAPTAKPVENEPIDTVSYTVGFDNESTIFNFLTEILGLNQAAASGILTNIACASYFRPGTIGEGGAAFGLLQWRTIRYAAMMSWCKSNNKRYATVDGQMWFLKHDLEDSYPELLAAMKDTENTPEGACEATRKWYAEYNSSAGDESVADFRAQLVQNLYYPKYKTANP